MEVEEVKELKEVEQEMIARELEATENQLQVKNWGVSLNTINTHTYVHIKPNQKNIEH